MRVYFRCDLVFTNICNARNISPMTIMRALYRNVIPFIPPKENLFMIHPNNIPNIGLPLIVR